MTYRRTSDRQQLVGSNIRKKIQTNTWIDRIWCYGTKNWKCIVREGEVTSPKNKYKKSRRKSQELREKVKLLFNDPISHRNPDNTEVYFSKSTQQIKTLKCHPLLTENTNIHNTYVQIHTHTHYVPCPKTLWNIQIPTDYNKHKRSYTYTQIIFITFAPFHELLCFRLHFMEVLSKVLDKIYGPKERTWVWLEKE